MIKTVVLDLDGPILDGQFRHYACYRKILVEHGYKPVSLENYWQMKRDRMDQRRQLAASRAETIYADFKESWLASIEMPDMLALDRIQPGALEKLREWRVQGIRLALVTQRRHRDYLYDQLGRLKLDSLLNHVVVSDPGRSGIGKSQQLKTEVADISAEDCLWVGDTEVDIEAARSFGCPVWAVACGLRSKSYLASLSPDFLSQDLTTVDLRCADGC
ncbi:MAG: hypothetical protein QOH70_837 [Blastocatellia bacterium]|jgi:phosphoglycolate phosphatase-like HAD superfamily hydrolase|nr:hypothetical protein [Blastocatellia bacterium]